MFKFDVAGLRWIREPERKEVTPDKVTIITQPQTDLWQRTYYGIQNDSAPILYMETPEQQFSFSVKTEFDGTCRFDQCGVIVYQDSQNWLKASIEYENGLYQRLGSVVTDHGYSDWATMDVPAGIRQMHYRLSRRGSDYLAEYSQSGTDYRQMRICHLREGTGKIRFGIYACSPGQSSFKAVFSAFSVTESMWRDHM